MVTTGFVWVDEGRGAVLSEAAYVVARADLSETVVVVTRAVFSDTEVVAAAECPLALVEPAEGLVSGDEGEDGAGEAAAVS